MLAKIRELRAFLEGANATPAMKAYLSELESELKRQKFGLVFEEHKEEIDEILETHTPVLTEDKSLFIDNGDPMNFLIEGDNLAVLTLLEKTHKGKIDLIYIDPPYNRGVDDFIYDDAKIVKTDSYIHSKWLSFMSVRLELARKLLAPNGVIFISIDDNEQANLKLLCDSIFGEPFFAGMIPWRKRTAKNDVPFGISQDFEWILIYAKESAFSAFTKRENERKYYKTDDIPEREWRVHDLTTQRTAVERPNSNFTLIDPKNGIEYPVNPNRVWAVTKDTFPTFFSEKRIIFPGDYPFLKHDKPVMRYFRDEDEAKALKKTGAISGISSVSTLLPNDVGMTQDGTKDLGVLFPNKVFPFPKPVNLIMHLIRMGTVNKPNAIILDFFAGSGTTGQAVLRNNAESENTNHAFILCTNNESNICRDVTYERIKRSISKENYNTSLKYQRIDYIPTSEQTYYDYADELLLHIRELVELENAINFEGNTDLAILLTEDEVEEFFANEQILNSVKTVYLGHDIALTLKQQQQVADNDITLNIIPEYYYKEQRI